MARKIIKLIFIVCWMGLIFSFSNDTGEESGGLSDKIVVKVVEVFKGELNSREKEEWIERLGYPIRKAAHMSEYFILCCLIVSFLLEFKYLCNYRGLLISFILCFIYACSDEIHQAFISGRSGNYIDVLFDSGGVLIGLIINKLFRKDKLR